MTTAMFVAIVATGLFAGASLYVTLVEHPAWMACGPAVSIKHFGPSTHRAGPMQGLLAMVGLVAGLAAWVQGSGAGWLVGGLLLGSLVPYTFLIVVPTNRRLLDGKLDSGSSEAVGLLARWGRLHAWRTGIGVVVFILFVVLAMR